MLSRRTFHAAVFLFAFAAMSVPPAHPQNTQPFNVPIEDIPVPPKGQEFPADPRIASYVLWHFDKSPADGFDSLFATISPQWYRGGDSNHVYWAFSSSFTNGQGWYMGLQPSGTQNRKMALFSVFGPGTHGLAPTCFDTADGGAGTSCHVFYDWLPGHRYQFSVRLTREDGQNRLWEGSVIDLEARKRSVIGEIAVPIANGYLKSSGALNFSELYRRDIPCEHQPHSEVLFFRPVGLRAGQTYPAALTGVRRNTECNARFFKGGENAVYAEVGTSD